VALERELGDINGGGGSTSSYTLKDRLMSEVYSNRESQVTRELAGSSKLREEAFF
jgi:hypothetical protein